MPRSFSSSMSSSICSCISRAETAPQTWRIRSESVVLPWSMWATIAKLRMKRGSVIGEPEILVDGPALRRAAERPARPGLGGRGRPSPLAAEAQVPGPRDHRRVVGRERAVREEDADSARLAPGCERRPQLRVRGDAARDGEERQALASPDGFQPVDESRNDRALEGGEEIRELAADGVGVERRAVHAEAFELAERRGLQAREGEVERAVAQLSDRKGEAVPVSAGGDA